MSRKRSRTVSSEHRLTQIFLGMLALAAVAGLLGQLAHIGLAP